MELVQRTQRHLPLTTTNRLQSVPYELELSLQEAAGWATTQIGRQVTPHNIQYLINYGRIRNVGGNGAVAIPISDLERYYADQTTVERKFKSKLGEDLNWALSFDQYREKERTKHVHRLHPYKGKFIPQLVEYFLDDHLDDFKTNIWFHPGDIVLDPFCGSGTTLVQANELGMHAIGVDVSEFNAWVSNIKLSSFDVEQVLAHGNKVSKALNQHIAKSGIHRLDEEFNEWLSAFNRKHFPSPEYKLRIRRTGFNEKSYVGERLPEVVFRYAEMVNTYGVEVTPSRSGGFLDRWYLPPVREQIDLSNHMIDDTADGDVADVLKLILSRTARTCRATTHADLATLQEPVWSPYYCRKHGKICRPLMTIEGWWTRYLKDTATRLKQFMQLRTDTFQHCLTGDARTLDIPAAVAKRSSQLAGIVNDKGIKGIFSSPPYVGLIDYHEQHAYAYELLGFDRRDHLEVGRLSEGQSKAAKESYVGGVADVLVNCANFMIENCDVFLVANDKHGLYPEIAERSSFEIVDSYRRPVLNRVEKNRSAYSETIFHMKRKR